MTGKYDPPSRTRFVSKFYSRYSVAAYHIPNHQTSDYITAQFRRHKYERNTPPLPLPTDYFLDDDWCVPFRQQQERLREMKTTADEERRRKQVEQQERLQSLYRQQEEALKKKRGAAGNAHRQLNGGGGVGSDNRDGPRAPSYDMSVHDIDEGNLGPDPGIWKSQAKQPVDVGDGGLVGGVAHQILRRRSNIADVDELPAGAQARAEILRSSPPLTGDVASTTSPSWRPGPGNGKNSPVAGDSFIPREMRRGGSPATNRRHGNDRGSPEIDLAASATATKEVRGSTYSTGRAVGSINAHLLDVRGGKGRTALPETPPAGGKPLRSLTDQDEPPLRTRSLLVPVSSDTLFPAHPADPTAEADARATQASALSVRGSELGGFGYATRVRESESQAVVAKAVDREAPTRAAPQDEMDAFVTSWQTEHFRRRIQEGSLVDFHPPQKQNAQDRRVAQYGYLPGSSPGSTAFRSLPHDLPRSSRVPPDTRIRGVGEYGDGKGAELEESLFATSRMIDSSLPLPPPAAECVSAVGREGEQRGMAGQDVVGEGLDASEQSLTSDSMLFYLTGQQQEPREAPASLPTSTARERRNTETRGGARGKTPDRRGQEFLGDRRGNGYRASPPVTTSLLSQGQGIGLEEAGSENQLSPLTRLLAETPVRLAIGGPRPKHAADSGVCRCFFLS